MPDTLTGLVLFVVLLAPGFTFLLVGERGRVATRIPSVLRETAAISLASIVFDILAVLLLLAVVAVTVLDGPDLDRLAAEGVAYARSSYRSTLGWFGGALVLACALAAVFAGVLNRTDRLAALRRRRPLSWLYLPRGGTEHVSAWWKVIIDPALHPEAKRYATCYLEDGSSVRGWVASANSMATDEPDRELVLYAPLVTADKAGVEREIPTGAATVSARRILFLHVRYLDKDAPAPGLEAKPPEPPATTPTAESGATGGP